MESLNVNDNQDPEEGNLGLLAEGVPELQAARALIQVDASDDGQEASARPSTLKSWVLRPIAFGLTAGLLLFALWYVTGERKGLVAATEEAERLQQVVMPPRTCPGTVGIAGLGQAALINTKPEAGDTAAQQIEVQGDTLIAHMKGRAYFGDTCAENAYDNNNYKGFVLLGNTLRYTMDLSGAGCGCNAAVYLVSMKQNTDVSTCGDYYCDANSVCGVSCTEVDIQEANMYAWRSTLHTADDRSGQAFGYGGTGDLALSWEEGKYGPGGQCIDTNRPFQVAVSFPVNADNTLQSMRVTLSQDGSPCPLTGHMENYGIPEITRALSEGMTPVVSFWSADSMTWLDGKGPKGGTCVEDRADQCPDSVKVYGFSLEQGAVDPAPTAVDATAAPAAPTASASAPPAAPTTSASVPPASNIITPVPEAPAVAASPAPAVVPISQQTTPPNVQAVPETTPLVPTGAPGWQEVQDTSGVVYYYNGASGQTSWSLPLK
jgi:hypothetical protein